MSKQLPRIAVTGLGVVSALGAGARASFERLCAGESGIRPLSLFEPSGLGTNLAGEVPGLDVTPGLDRADALVLLAAREALEQAAWIRGAASLSLALGATAGGMLETESELVLASRAGDNKVWPRARRLLTHPLSSTELAVERELGPLEQAVSVCSACSSGALAIIVAAHWIASGRCDAVLAGGVDPLCRMTYAGFNSLGVLASEPCRPFDVARRGLTLGEGAGLLLLESEENATRRGVRILAWLSGFAAGAEAHHVTHPQETGERAAELMQRALDRAGRQPSEVEYVNAHGTGTPANDAMEARALDRVFGAELANVFVSSCKGQLGHTLGAAGAIEAAVSVLALESGRVPPTGGLREPEVPLRHVIGTAKSAKLSAVLSNSFGFGGMDAVLLFEAAESERRGPSAMQQELVVSAAADLGGPGSAVDLTAQDPRDALDAERSRRFDQSTACSSLLVEAALGAANCSPTEVGLVLGGAFGPVERSLKFLDRILERGLRTAPPAEFPNLVKSAGAGNVSIYAGTLGPALSVSALGASGDMAFELACALVELGLCNAALGAAVEVDDAIVRELWSHSYPDGPARSEGGACLLVEPEAHARARAQRPLVRVGSRANSRAGLASALAHIPAPLEGGGASVVLACRRPVLDAALDSSAWGKVARHRVDELGYHEALGANALVRAVQLIAAGTSHVLVVNADDSQAFATELLRIEDA